MNRIYLVRHGENPANITKELSHRKVDYSLTPKGVLQAQQTAEYFSALDIHEVYSSPLKRALETADIIAQRLGLTVEVVESFRELNVGILEDQGGSPEAWEIFFQVAQDWMSGKLDTAFPGGEDYHTLWCRIRAGLEHVVAGKTGRSIVVVGHGGIFGFTLREFCRHLDLNRLFSRENHNCAITEVRLALKEGRLEGELVSWALCTHLQGEAADLVRPTP